MTRVCSKCGVEKEVSAFHRCKRNKDGYSHQCKDCVNAYSRNWLANKPGYNTANNQKWRAKNRGHVRKKRVEEYQRDKKKVAALSRKWLLRRQYNLTLKQYDEMLKAQGGVCAICGEDNGERNLVVDHNHETNKIRGLLCTKCNAALGLLGDDLPGLLAAASYLAMNDA